MCEVLHLYRSGSWLRILCTIATVGTKAALEILQMDLKREIDDLLNQSIVPDPVQPY